jgi:hypothetical protein
LVAIPIAAVWLSIILFYTRGGLLVGADWAGYYNAFAAIRTGIPDAITYGTGLLLAGGNIYAGFYVGTFIGICLNLFALSYFLNTLFEEWRGKIVPLAIANILYAFSMFSIYNTFKSVIDVAGIATGGLLLFLALVIKLYRYMNKSGRFTKLDGLLMGIGIAVSSMVPPNCFRILLIEGTIMIGVLLLALIKQTASKTSRASKAKSVLKGFILKLPLIAVVAALGMLYWEISFFSSFATNLKSFSSASQSLSLSTLNAPYATLINTFRIFGVWVFTEGYCPYYKLYFNNLVITITSFIWPVMALGMSLLFVKRSQRLKILILVAFSLLIITWDTANNPPVGVINLFTASHFPIILSFFQTFYLSNTLLPIIYVALSTYVIFRVIETLRSSKRGVSRFLRKMLVVTIPVLLIAVLLIADTPFFTGNALEQYFSPNTKGIWVPNDYFVVKDLLSSSMQSGKSALLWPSMTTYILTSWQYQGSNVFYNAFFAPLNVYTPSEFGGYSLANPQIAAEYYNLTSIPLKSGPTTNITSYADFANLSVQGASYTHIDNTIKLGLSNNSSDYIDVTIPFRDTFDASNYTFFTLQFSTDSAPLIENMLSNQKLWVGVGSSDGNVGWYILGSTSSSAYSINNSTIIISMHVGFPDKPWSESTYNSTSVSDFVFRIFTQGLPSNSYDGLTLSSITIGASFVVIDQSILKLWQQYNIEYVVFDNSIISGAAVATQEYLQSINYLINEKLLIPVFTGDYIQLYKVNYNPQS